MNLLKSLVPALSFFIFLGLGFLVGTSTEYRFEKKAEKLEMVNTWTDSLEILISDPTPASDNIKPNLLIIKNL